MERMIPETNEPARNGDRILQVRDLEVAFKTYAGEVNAVRGVSFDLCRGETLAVVGESGSGKTVAAKSIIRLLEGNNNRIKGGEAFFEGRDLLKMSERRVRALRGREIAMIFQDPMTSLNPTMKVGKQITETLKRNMGMSGRRARRRAAELLEMVGIPDPAARLKHYPHQFSGGMRQRVVIAIAIACDPKVLIADEPTTALDVTIQAQILDLLRDLQERLGTSIVLITHDLGVVANKADRVAVMYAGKVAETGTVREIFHSPRHPYTWGLLTSVPRTGAERNKELVPIPGAPPDPIYPPAGCPFAARCPHAMQVCNDVMPERTELSPTHQSACWLEHELAPNVRPPLEIRGGAR